MDKVHLGGDAGAAGGSPVCPNCDGILTDQLICWKCCDRLCPGCGRPTGSAFIIYCWPCSYHAAEEERLKKWPGLASQ
jgi:hypothetical protein